MPEERKLVTILFADIVGSTAITVARDPEVVRATMRRTFDEIGPIIESHGGTVEKFIGDEVMAVFGVPQGHDDDADRAVRAAFAIRERVRDLSARPKAVPLELRIGINSGETVAGSGEGGQFLVTGEPVNAAARIRGSAEPGEIVVGALTKRLTDRSVEYGDTRTFEAKGIGLLESWPAVSLRSAVPAQFRGIEGLRAPLIGRDEEMSLLLNAFDRMRNEARPHLITVFGAAGAGKSRVTEEFIARIDSKRVRMGRCLPYGEGITLWPIQLILRQDAGFVATDDLATARRRIREAAVAAFPGAPDDAEGVEKRLLILAGLARADEVLPEIAPADLASELGWGLRRYLERRAQDEPLVLVFEDIHWAAPALLELVEELVEWAKAPLFILCLARPEFLDTRPGWGGGKVNAASIVLEPLTPEETRELVAKLLDIDSLSEDVRSTVIERAEGNPLYVEEFIRLLIESGQIGQRAGRWIAMNVGPLHVPPTLQGLIAARMDTASPEVKILLQRAAVVGRFFTTTGVAALSDGKAPDQAQLKDAVRRDLLVDSDDRGVGGGRVFRFKHVLIRDVAYASVPKTLRAILHDRYCRWYEEMLGDRRADFIDLIAHHAEQAYLLANEMAMAEASELGPRAFERLMSAAASARTREDWPAALALYRRVAAVADGTELTDVQRVEAEGYLALGRHVTEASVDAAAAVDELIGRARASGATNLLSELMFRRIGHYPAERRSAAREELLGLARADQDPEQMIRALILSQGFGTTFPEELAMFREALAHARQHGLVSWERKLFASVIRLEAWHGEIAAAQRHLAEYEAQLGAPSTRERLDHLVTKAQLHAVTGEPEAALPLIGQAIAISRELGDVRQESVFVGALANFNSRAGKLEAALALSEERLALIGARAMPWQRRGARIQFARILALLGRGDDARTALDEALSIPIPDPTAFEAVEALAAASVAAERGDQAEADRGFATYFAEARRIEEFNPGVVFEHARYLLRYGRLEEARQTLSELRARVGDAPAPVLIGLIDDLLTQTAAVRA